MDNGFTINVLDKGYVKLIDSMGTDETVVEAARMSTGKGFRGWDKDTEFLEFLYMNRHMTPFEMGELAIEVKAPIFVFREWHRHRTQSYNEFSARYEVMPNEHYLPDLGRIQKQSQLNKQGSGEALSEDIAGMVIGRLQTGQEEIYSDYEEMLNKGVSKEVARINTPVSRFSKMRAKTDVRNWLGYLMLRMENSAMWEIRQYANAVAQIIKALWPRTFDLFLEHDFFAVRFSRTEMRVLRKFLEEGWAKMGNIGLDQMSQKKVDAFLQKLTVDKESLYPHLKSGT